MGCRQAVRQWTLTPSSVGSNPTSLGKMVIYTPFQVREVRMKDFNDVMKYCNQNKDVYEKIVQGVREKKLVPFIGTGLPSAIKENRKSIFPVWKILLKRLAHSIQRKEVSQYIKYLVDNGKYTEAAQIIAIEHGPKKLNNELRLIFDSKKIPADFTPAQKKAVVFMLPEIFNDTLMLTNVVNLRKTNKNRSASLKECNKNLT